LENGVEKKKKRGSCGKIAKSVVLQEPGTRIARSKNQLNQGATRRQIQIAKSRGKRGPSQRLIGRPTALETPNRRDPAGNR
jgi:hypothetical protein